MKAPCPICQISELAYTRDGDNNHCDCPRCGKFSVTGTALAILKQREPNPLLSAWIRQANVLRQEIPSLDSSLLDRLGKDIRSPSVLTRQQTLIRSLARLTDAGAWFPVSSHTEPLAWAKNGTELDFHLNALAERGLIEFQKDLESTSISLTTDGWIHAEELDRSSEDLHQAFVAMSFSDDMYQQWERGFAPAISAAGYKPHRVDGRPHNQHIDLKIMADIRDSRFVVADFTENKHGVYFEAGYARGLGREVIWCVRKDHVDKLHFDTRQMGHIVWSSADELRNVLSGAIVAIVGRGTWKAS